MVNTNFITNDGGRALDIDKHNQKLKQEIKNKLLNGETISKKDYKLENLSEIISEIQEEEKVHILWRMPTRANLYSEYYIDNSK